MKTTAGLGQELRRRLASLGQRGAGRRYPEDFKRDAMDYVTARRAEGVQVEAAVRELGLSEKTLERWRARGRVAVLPQRFRTVEVAAADSATPNSTPAVPAAAVAPRLRLTVHGPLGLRIEGLDVWSVACLWRELA